MRRVYLCPVSPFENKPRGPNTSAVVGSSVDGEAIDPKFVQLGDRIVGVEKVTLDERGPGALEPKAVKPPREMTGAQKAKHWLTHLPYDPGCPICISCRRPNNKHIKSHEQERTIPLVVGDYTPVRDSRDEDYAELLVMKVYPFRLIFACVVDHKGPDPRIVARLSKWIIDSGLVHFAYRSDQEPAIVALIREACSLAGRNGVHVQADEAPSDLADGDLEVGEPQTVLNEVAIDKSLIAVPEHSHPGESQSNGLAERSIQELVGQLRTLKLSLETRLKVRLPCHHPVFAWLVEHSAYVLNHYQLGLDGRTAHGRLHGKEVSEYIAEFGERVLYYVPKKQRSKLDVRWRYGTFLGRATNSDQNYIGLNDGTVTCARAMVRLVHSIRWNSDRVSAIAGTPMELKTQNLNIIEEDIDPHAHPEEHDDKDVEKIETRRLQISMKHLRDFGYTESCPRCAAHRSGNQQKAKRLRHTPACRKRVYQAIREAGGDPRDAEIQQPVVAKEPEIKEVLKPPISPVEPATPRADDVIDDDMIIPEQPAPPLDVQENEDDIAEVFGDFGDDDMAHDDPMAADDRENSHEEVGADQDHEMIAMMDVLQTLGVEVEAACRFSSDVIKTAQRPSLVEAYGTGNIIDMANTKLRNLNIDGLCAFDLRVAKPNGSKWDFSKARDRIEATEFVKKHKPTWVIGSPPCTPFSQLQGLNFPKMPKEKVAAILREGRKHLRFVIGLYKIQLDGKRHFLHEHPAGATSWQDAMMKKLLRIKGVLTVVSDQCQYGLMTPGPDGRLMPAKKPTRWASSSIQMTKRLSKRCDKSHMHQHLMGGRAANAAFYPPELITEILRGIRDTADASHKDPEHSSAMMLALARAGALHDQPAKSIVAAFREADLGHSNAKRSVLFKFLDGRTVSLDLEKNFRESYKDEYTNEVLPSEGTKDAMYDELEYFCDKVFRGVTLDEARRDHEGKIVGCRWVNSNKGDSENPDVRCRLVAQEVNNGAESPDFYAATPKLEAKRLLFSEWATERTRRGKKLKLSFVDIRKAYFNGRPKRNIYIRLPPELGLPRETLGKLARCMYGTRDAGAIWEQCFADCLVQLGFQQGAASPCCFHHPAWEVSVVVHGDDFTALGTDESLDKYEKGLEASFECKLRGRLGLDKDDLKEIRVLNRIVRITEDGLRYEADPRHAELLAKSMGLNDCKPVATPGLKVSYDEKCHDLPISDDHELVAPLSTNRRQPTRVAFKEEIETRSIISYDTVYGIHPSKFVFGADGVKIPISSDMDAHTGISNAELRVRRSEIRSPAAERARILRKTLLDGAAWEPPTSELIMKASTKKFKPKRIGAKAAKKAERFESAGEILNDAEATTFRALAARANYLALDRPECAYATKELCRFFSSPTHTGVEQLKRLVRYLVGAPRLVWEFDFQNPTNQMSTFVDTDFGGCHVTRRSTSGGVATRGNHTIKHWSTTQATVALSSAEAELTGICKGASQGLGLQSLAADLGIPLELTILTDATAAIGIARRRGLGKIRHLATADLWVQDRLRRKDFQLVKVLGVDNPADMLTKHLDKASMVKHMKKLGLSLEEGRAESAPCID